MIECHYADLTVSCTVGHPIYLRVDRSLHTLNSRHVGHATLSLGHELLRTIAEIAHHLGMKFSLLVALELMFSSYRLCYAH